MNADQEQQMVASLNRIADSLELLTRYAFQAFIKFDITPPQPVTVQKKVGHPIPGQRGRA